VHSFTALFTNHGQNHFPEPNRHTLDFLHPILLCRITYRAPLEMLFQLQKQKQLAHYNFNPFRQVVSGGGFVFVCPSIKIREAHVKVPNSCSFACFNLPCLLHPGHMQKTCNIYTCPSFTKASIKKSLNNALLFEQSHWSQIFFSSVLCTSL
jgi:hypothetical protein